MGKALAVISGLGIGAGLMYLFDPDGGNRRRALIRDKTVHLTKKTQDAINGQAKHLTNRAKGLLHEAKTMLPIGH